MPERRGGVARRRLHAERQLVHLCSTKRSSSTESPLEGEPDIIDYAEYLDGEPCLMYTVSAREQRVENGPWIVTRQIKIQFAYSADVEQGDQITAVVDRFGEQRNAEILGIDGIVTLDTHLEVEATEVGRIHT